MAHPAAPSVHVCAVHHPRLLLLVTSGAAAHAVSHNPFQSRVSVRDVPACASEAGTSCGVRCLGDVEAKLVGLQTWDLCRVWHEAAQGTEQGVAG